jgi:Cohesin domain
LLKAIALLVVAALGFWITLAWLEPDVVAEPPVVGTRQPIVPHESPVSDPAAGVTVTATVAASAPVTAEAVRPRPAPRSELALEAPSQARVGERIHVTVNASVPEGASTFSFTLRFDPRVWKFIDATQGTFMAEASAVAELRTNLDLLAGIVTVTLEQDGGPPVTGSGGLVVFQFEAIGRSPAPSRLALSQVSVAAFDRGEMPSIGSGESVIQVNQ